MTAYKEELRTKIMKLFKHILGAGVLVGALTLPNVSRAADQAASAKAKPYPLQVCIVSDAKLGSMGVAFATTFVLFIWGAYGLISKRIRGS